MTTPREEFSSLWRGKLLTSLVGVLVLAACSAAGASPGTEAPVVAMRIAAPVYAPVWSDHAKSIFALTEDGRIAKITSSDRPGTARTLLSAPFPDVGENLVTRITTGVVYLPQPKLGLLALVDDVGLRQVGSLRAGPAPAFLALGSGADDLLALSEDRSSVTPVDLHDDAVLPSEDVHAGPEAELDAAKRGRRIDVHVTGPEGITHLKGSPGAVGKEGELGISAEKTAGDLVKSSRLYVAERGTDRLLAVDSTRGEDGLEVVGHAELGEPVHDVGVDETLIYAATERTLVVLETNSFEGYRDGVIPVVETVDFRSALPDATRNAPLSGLAVGPDRVYLTLQGVPYVVSIAKPSI